MLALPTPLLHGCRDRLGTTRAPGAAHLSQVWHLTRAHRVGKLRQHRYSVLKPGHNHSLLALVAGLYENRQLVRLPAAGLAGCAGWGGPAPARQLLSLLLCSQAGLWRGCPERPRRDMSVSR